MIGKMRIFAAAAAFLFVLAVAGRAETTAADVDAILKRIESTSSARELELIRWKVHQDMDSRCLDPHFIPDKTWKSAMFGMTFPLSEKGVWLWTKVKIPEKVSGMEVTGSRVSFHAAVVNSADVYVNGQWKENMTGADSETVVANSVKAGEEYVIVAHVVSRRIVAAFATPRLRFTAPNPLQRETAFLRNDVETIRALAGYTADPARWNALSAKAVSLIDLDAIDKKDTARLLDSIKTARKELEPFREIAGKYGLFLIGYSHIDLAWLWDKKEGEEVWVNTSKTILNLMKEYPEWIYCAGQAAGYWWMEKDYPELFAEIKQRIAEGRWEIVGGTWAEFDSNVPGGESYVRQLLYGKRYFREKFGKDIVVAWTPDSFGYNWNLAQIYKKAGMIGLVTQKINWNDTTRFPHHVFWWEGPDGSKLLTYFPVGSYGESLDTGAMLSQIKTMTEKEKVAENYAIFGVGDHGGGVTRTHLNRAFAFKDDPLFPKTSFISSVDYFNRLLDMSKKQEFPVYKDELYLEYHRGTYTSQANTKRNNRAGEIALMNAETFASVAALGGLPYARKPLRDAWDILMFNQFHDILPGSSIREVYRDADADYAEMFSLTGGVLDGALDAIAAKADTAGDGQALMLFNSLAWPRRGVVELTADAPESAAITDENGAAIPAQTVEGADGAKKLLILSNDIPAAGYAVYRLAKGPAKQTQSAVSANGNSLENEFLRVTVDPKTGDIASLVDKRDGREYFGPGHAGNKLQCYRDKHPEYDAWNIRLHEEKPVELVSPPEVVENGPVRATIRLTKKTGDSTFIHYISLVVGVPQVFARLDVDWRESHVMAKLAFDLNLQGDTAWYEIPYAAIPRAAVAKTDADRAKWEVSAQKWVDYTAADGSAGLTLVNNSKYGFDTKGSVMRMSLLRSPKDPDPIADMHRHVIEYALIPHAGDWRAAGAPNLGLEFNAPLIARVAASHPGELPRAKSFFSVEPANVILAAVKVAEDSGDLVLRLYESTGVDSKFKVTLPAAAKVVEETNLMEENGVKLPAAGAEVSGEIGHYEIKTLKVSF